MHRLRVLFQPRSYRVFQGAAGRWRWQGPPLRFGALSGWLTDARAHAVARHIAGASVLDVGCNTAYLARVIPPNVDYVGLEVVPEIVDLARRLHPERRFEQCDVEGAWPASVTERRFDHVALLAVIEHLGRPERVLEQARAVLGPGGSIIVTTPHPRARRLHALGARLRLFSRDADAEHERFLGRADLAAMAHAAGLTMTKYRTFLLGLNQVAVMRVGG